MQEPSAVERVIPTIRYSEDLPIAQKRDDIAAAIEQHQVVIIAGETGSGKTTQLPKICLELGRGRTARIGHTQPRRLAARTVASRIAAELGGSTGDLVGYQVRFSDRLSDNTAVKLMTDGILLSEMQRDRMLKQYDTLIIDEAHERSLNIDFILGYLKRILPRRPDLKVIVTSATIDVAAFSRHFDDAPVIEVSGRSYPVEINYLGIDERERDSEHIVGLVTEIASGCYGERGDALIFLPGEREIRELARLLRGLDAVEVLPLYARLSQAEQNRVFDSARKRSGIRVVLATNVAETSLTVPGIRFVIDPGLARISRYSHRSQLQRLPVEPVSQASAAQRAGRCGRIGPGVCFRLYSEEDFLARAEFTEPEIQRTNLAAVVLQMLSLGLGEVGDFPFINPPDVRLIRDGYKVLEELGAVSAVGKLTSLGRRLAYLPVDPRIGRMLLQASKLGCVEAVLVIASALSVQDPRERPTEKQQQADQSHARFRHERSDFMAWLSLWQYFETQRRELSQNQLRKLCRREFLSYSRMREWRDIHTQLSIAARQQNIRVALDDAPEADYRGIHQSLLAGLLSNIAQQHEGREYRGSRNRKLTIFPGSSQAKKTPAWLVAAQIVETSRVYAREVAAIDPRWALDINPQLLKYHHYEPHWRARRGQVLAKERVTLFGLTLSDKRQVHYGPINPVESRELLIREGLVEGNYRQYPEFLRHNRRLQREVEGLEARTRRRDLLAQDRELFDFYDQRLPGELCTSRALEAWIKREPQRAVGLRMDREVLLARDPGEGVDAQFPAALDWQGTAFKLSYEFEPGNTSDGVSVTIPVALLNRAPRFLFDWLVPGLLREKCIALIKGLPKELRRPLVPVPDTVDRLLSVSTPADTDLLQAMSGALRDLTGQRIDRAQWRADALDDYYRMNVRVVDANGHLLAQGRDLPALVERFRQDTRDSVSRAVEDSPVREGLVRWDFDELPQRWQFRQAGVDIVAWPALVDRGDSVAIELCDYQGEAAISHRLGVLRLAQLNAAEPLRYLRKHLLVGNDSQLSIAATGMDRDELLKDLCDAAFVEALELDGNLPYDPQAFTAKLDIARANLVPVATALEKSLLSALRELAQVKRQLAAMPGDARLDSRQEIEQQLVALFAPHFLRDTPTCWRSRYPVYTKALRQRVERLSGQYAKDQKYCAMLAALTAPLREAIAQRPALLVLSGEAADYRWMLEEFRVSLFAQNLGTVRPVSEKRLRQAWQGVADWLVNHPA